MNTASPMSSAAREIRADALIARLDLEAFIRSWNTGGGSVIATYDAFLVALSFEADRLAAFEAAFDEGATEGDEYFDGTLRRLLDPVITGTAITATLCIVDRWAEDLVAALPEIVAETAPFASLQDFVDWVVANDASPAELCDPDGERILDEASIETLLGRALTTATPKGAQSPWLDGTP